MKLKFSYITLFIATLPATFYLTAQIINPILYIFKFIGVWEYGFYINPSSNPIYLLAEAVHILISIGLAIIITNYIDKYTFFQNLKYWDITKIVIFVAIYIMIFIFLLNFLNLPIYETLCVGGGSQFGCVLGQKFHSDNFIIIIFLGYSISFWLAHIANLIVPKFKKLN